MLRAISICRIQCYVREFLNLSDRVFRFGYLPEAAKLLGPHHYRRYQYVGAKLGFYIAALAVDVDVSYLLIGAIVVIVELVRLIPLTVQGIGVREATRRAGSGDRVSSSAQYVSCS